MEVFFLFSQILFYFFSFRRDSSVTAFRVRVTFRIMLAEVRLSLRSFFPFFFSGRIKHSSKHGLLRRDQPSAEILVVSFG